MEVAVCIFCRGALEADVTKVVQRKLVEIYDAVMVEVSALKLCIHVLLNAPPRLHVTPRLECCPLYGFRLFYAHVGDEQAYTTPLRLQRIRPTHR